MRAHPVLSALAGALLCAGSLSAQLTTPLDSVTLAGFRWRAIGPAVMGGRVTDIEGVPGNPKVFYVATATGGIWKTINAGTMFVPLFDKERVISMGDIALAPSNPDIIYAGTGEEDSRNSISPGGGVYKSTDGGRTWKQMGLEATQQIGRIVVDPVDPNIVYVAALGHAWNSNPERGLYKSTDGGATWKLSKFVSDKAGFVDLAMDPKDHNTLYAASWERVRGPYFLESGGPGSGLWKSTDAGESWREIKGGGFPETTKGRIGIAVSPSNSQIVYTWVEADTLPRPLARGEKPDTSKRQKTPSGIYKSTDGGATWTLTYRNEPPGAGGGGLGDARPFYYSQIRVDPRNPDRIYWMSSVFRSSDDGGKTYRRGALGVHTDWHAMWIDPTDPEHYILGDDGGIAVSYDRGGTYDFINTFPIGQFYAVSYSMEKPYKVCGGLQDNGSWCGPSRARNRVGITNGDWYNVGGGDGFYTAIDPEDGNTVYSESQGGNASRLNIAQNTRTVIMRGGGRDRTSIFEDSVIIARGDTTRPETPDITRTLAAIRARASADSARGYRFNWSTPFLISPHSSSTIYMGGNRLLKSTDRGDHFYPISADLSTRDSARIIMSTKLTGGVTRDNSGAETHGTITTVAESPIRPGILWVGTDDGNVWMSTNDGGQWTDITTRFPGVPRKTWVSRVEPSHFDSATVYVTFDNHRENDFKPYVFVSNDFGRTFRSIAGNLPTGAADFVHVIREDPVNRDLLFLGSDVGAYVSTDRGATWQRFMTGLPTVPVHDLKIHPRDRELIAATHGRSIWIVDISPLEEMNNALMSRSTNFFTPKTAYEYSQAATQNFTGNKTFVAPNPTYGAELVYRLTSGSPRDTTRILVTNIRGDTVRTLTGPGGPGVHRAYWDLRQRARPLGPAALRDSINGARLRRQRDDSVRAARADTSEGASRGGAAGGGRRGGGRGGQGDVNLRPAESPTLGGGGGGGEGGGGGGGGFFGGGRAGSIVEAGDYMVTINASGQIMRQVVHVERVGDIVNVDFGPDEGDEDGGGDPLDP
jgi:Sortilin, neurotensin receptor 3,